MDDTAVDAYLQRIGGVRPGRRDLDALRELQIRHLLTVPFENLGIHLDEQISLDEPALLDKVVGRRRGGFCYELNGVFGGLLTALGFDVTLLAARVQGGDGFGPPFDHLALRVLAADGEVPGPWLVDVGFGQFAHYPLRLDVAADQVEPGGTFRVIPAPDGDVDIVCGDWVEYRLEPHPRVLTDFEPTCWWHRTSPKSHFTNSLVCSRLTERGRITLSGRTLIETDAGQRRKTELHGDEEVLDAYDRHFGVRLDRVPEVRTAGRMT